MLIGDPSKFAIAWNIVKDWNTSFFSNGTFDIYVNFTLLGNRKNIVHEVGSNLYELFHLASQHELQRTLASNYFKRNEGKSESEIYNFLRQYTFPSEDDGQPEGREYLAVPFAIYDDGDVMFLVKDEGVDRLYYGTDDNFKGSICLPGNQYSLVVSEAWSAFQSGRDSV